MMGEATCKLRRLAREYPGVRTLVLADIPGTFDLVDTQAATRFLRQQGWNTLVPGNGRIASGGVMLFLGGVERTVEPGGQVGVHAWSQTWQGAVYSSPTTFPRGLSGSTATSTAIWGSIRASMTFRSRRHRPRISTG